MIIDIPPYGGWLRNPAPVGRCKKSDYNTYLHCFIEIPIGIPTGAGFRNHPQ
jgi:hypothetical protein